LRRGILNIVFLGVISAIVISCNGGLEPEPPAAGVTGFTGKVTFTGNWPKGIKRTHLVAFKTPIVQVTDFFPPNLSIILDSIPYGTREYNFNSVVNNFGGEILPGDYAYVVVAQSKTPLLSLLREDWTVAGVYYAPGNSSFPGTLRIEKDKTTQNINIICDFNNPPPQPPGGL